MYLLRFYKDLFFNNGLGLLILSLLLLLGAAYLKYEYQKWVVKEAIREVQTEKR